MNDNNSSPARKTSFYQLPLRFDKKRMSKYKIQENYVKLSQYFETGIFSPEKMRIKRLWYKFIVCYCDAFYLSYAPTFNMSFRRGDLVFI